MPANTHYVGGREPPKDWIMLDIAEAISGPVHHVLRGFAGCFMNTTKHAKMALQHNKMTQQSNSENIAGRITQNTCLLVAIIVTRKARFSRVFMCFRAISWLKPVGSDKLNEFGCN